MHLHRPVIVIICAPIDSDNKIQCSHFYHKRIQRNILQIQATINKRKSVICRVLENAGVDTFERLRKGINTGKHRL